MFPLPQPRWSSQSPHDTSALVNASFDSLSAPKSHLGIDIASLEKKLSENPIIHHIDGRTQYSEVRLTLGLYTFTSLALDYNIFYLSFDAVLMLMTASIPELTNDGIEYERGRWKHYLE